MKFSEDIQKLLPLGYLYLVVIGILKESFFYYQLGINIFKYSTLMDILLSPIAEITSNLITLSAVILAFTFHYFLPGILPKYKHIKLIQKLYELKSTDNLSEEETINYYNNVALRSLAMILLSFFVGTGIGSGHFEAKRIEENKLEYNYKINYSSGESEQVHIINTNSLYYFYVVKGSKNIKITPIGAIKNIELLDSKMGSILIKLN